MEEHKKAWSHVYFRKATNCQNQKKKKLSLNGWKELQKKGKLYPRIIDSDLVNVIIGS